MFGGGTAATLLHPVVALEIGLAILLILCLPRKYVIAPLLLAIFTIPLGQVLVLGGAHFTMARILVVAGALRLMISRRSFEGGVFAGGFNKIDCVFLLWAVCFWAAFSLQWLEVQAFVKSAANFVDAAGGYVVMRAFIRDREDVKRTIKVFACLCLILGICMVVEQVRHANPFGAYGGISSLPAERNGKVRSQAAFDVYLTAGAFGATLIPLFVWVWSEGRSRFMAAVGIIGATVMTVTTNSSTPEMAYAVGILGLCLWPARRQMRIFRWTIVCVLLGLHLTMKAPVWALIGRLDLTGSSTSYDRFLLVDNCIRHFSDWWLVGYRYYDQWGPDMWDLSNQYVAYALRGGLVTLVLSLFVISRSFGRLGDARKLVEGTRSQEWLLWCLGSAIAAHLAAYFGVNYFDQMQFAWYALLALISAATADVMNTAVTRSAQATEDVTGHELGYFLEPVK
jgi:hypothetical protein